ncbi:hypothetical protein WICPIJ_003148 [Wickerhamomyces pijperi]|uniref:Uncharacterized protein n=1 Tax=Wickerhamomyces pijperi TaxID=599730 RepID=A0A9P8QA35_WICPI|nr:hypothetical protein WICPIJ_003148 [Wickerhamomyces pijperi]
MKASCSEVPFSAKSKDLSGSKTEFNLSKTESSANEISSRRKYWPEVKAWIKGPSVHSNRTFMLLLRSEMEP